MNNLVKQLPYIRVCFKVNNHPGGLSSDLVRNGYMIDGSGMRRPVLGHILPLNGPDLREWMDYSISYRHQNLLCVLACTDEKDYPGMRIVLIEHCDTTFAEFLQNDPIIVTTQQPSTISYTYAVRNHLKGILTGIVYLRYSGCPGNGNISINNIYIVEGVAKLGSVSVGGRAAGDMNQFCDMLQNLSHSTVPDELFYFISSVTQAGPRLHWMECSIANSPNHPLWMTDEELMMYHSEVLRKLEEIERHDPILYFELRKEFRKRLKHYIILNTDWMTNIIVINDVDSVAVFNYQLTVYTSNPKNVFGFAKFGQHYHLHAREGVRGGVRRADRQRASQGFRANQGFGANQGASQGFRVSQGFGQDKDKDKL